MNELIYIGIKKSEIPCSLKRSIAAAKNILLARKNYARAQSSNQIKGEESNEEAMEAELGKNKWKLNLNMESKV
jgi:hypothetical protein